MASRPDTVGGEFAALRRATAHEAGVAGTHSGDATAPEKDVPAGPVAARGHPRLHGPELVQATSAGRHDPDGTAPMAGMGECATGPHVCHGDNECRGQGGCGYAGSDVEQIKPGDQSCNANGSCASPINVSRVSSAGPNKGKSVWKRRAQDLRGSACTTRGCRSDRRPARATRTTSCPAAASNDAAPRARPARTSASASGCGRAHFAHLEAHWPQVDWFEVISENFMDSRGRPRHVLDEIVERYPVVAHGVSLSIGSTDPLDLDYLARLKRFVDEIDAVWVSDHVCWTGVGGRQHARPPADPLHRGSRWRMSSSASGSCRSCSSARSCSRTRARYVTYVDSTMTEWEFLARMAEEADCGLLLDVNNVYVSSVNHDFDPVEYLRALPHERVVQMHLAGHTDLGTHLVDTHDRPVCDAVWELYRAGLRADRRRVDADRVGRARCRRSRRSTPRCSRRAISCRPEPGRMADDLLRTQRVDARRDHRRGRHVAGAPRSRRGRFRRAARAGASGALPARLPRAPRRLPARDPSGAATRARRRGLRRVRPGLPRGAPVAQLHADAARRALARAPRGDASRPRRPATRALARLRRRSRTPGAGVRGGLRRTRRGGPGAGLLARPSSRAAATRDAATGRVPAPAARALSRRGVPGRRATRARIRRCRRRRRRCLR